MIGTPADVEYTQLVTALHSCCADRFETEREASHITLASILFRGLKFGPDPGGKTLTIGRTVSWNASVVAHSSGIDALTAIQEKTHVFFLL